MSIANLARAMESKLQTSGSQQSKLKSSVLRHILMKRGQRLRELGNEHSLRETQGLSPNTWQDFKTMGKDRSQ